MQVKATVLVDNNEGLSLAAEWGFSLLIEYSGRKILLDTGKSAAFAENAERLSIDLADVDYAVLSHAHYDHSDGMADFFSRNDKAAFCLRVGTEENCYSGYGADRHYIGIKQGVLSQFENRIKYVDGCYKLFEGAYLLPHIYDMTEAGKRARMYLYRNGEWQIDRFQHEQSLVLETERGLVVFNSCCHGGADTVIKEAAEYFGVGVYALVGGLHLFRLGKADIISMAEKLRETGVQRIVTGHCTGDTAMEILKCELPHKVEQIYSGYVVQF